jgi:pimeloyl-ACP methyl ester carboxylesterase
LPAAFLACGAAVPKWECATVPVPLDYAAPDGEKISLNAVRIRSTLTAATGRRGSVWVMCGGPGMAQQPEIMGVLYKFLGCAFDLYFVDYRGTGQSTNLGSDQCIADSTAASPGIDVVNCAKNATAKWGAKLLHFSVTNIARDFDYLIPLVTSTTDTTEVTVVLGYSWGTYVANRMLQVMAKRTDKLVYITGAILDAVCTPGLCKATNIGVAQDRAGRMLLGRYCARDPSCVKRLGGDPVAFAMRVFDRLDAGALPCAAALKLKRPELQTLLNSLAGGHSPVMKLPLGPALLYRLDRCAAGDLQALNHSITAARAASAAGVPLPPGASIVQELNVEYGDMWRASVGGSAGEALIPTQAVIDAGYDNFLFVSNDEAFAGFNAKTVRPGYEVWNKFDADEFVGGFAPPLVPILLLNGDVDPAVDNDANAQISSLFYTAAAGAGERSNVHLVTIPYAGHTTLGQSPVRCTDANNPLLCTVGSDGVGINGGLAPACGAQIAVSFVQNTSGPLNLDCLQNLFPLDFEGQLSLTRTAALAEFGITNLWDNDETPMPVPPPTPAYTCATKPLPPNLPEEYTFSFTEHYKTVKVETGEVIDDVKTIGTSYFSNRQQSTRGIVSASPGTAHGEAVSAINYLNVADYSDTSAYGSLVTDLVLGTCTYYHNEGSSPYPG